MSHPLLDRDAANAAPVADAPTTDAPSSASRRDLLRGAAATAASGLASVAGVAALTDAADAQPPVTRVPQAPRTAPKRLTAQPPMLPRRFAGVDQARQPSYLLEPTHDWENWALRLARRVTLGLTPEESARAKRLGYYGYLDYQLAYEQIDDSAAEAFVARTYPSLAMTGTEMAALELGVLQQQLQDATVYRAAFSKRQLYQRMVEFWTDHFTIYYPEVGYLKTLDDREVIRKHALGNFGDLVKASAHSAAMLVYLDQNVSRRGAPNQNYARELLELHTMGVDGGYTQNDVAELSRILTGWTIRGRGEFLFSPALHDYAQKVFLGRTFPAMDSRNNTNMDGVTEGDAVLDMLIAHPSTAKFIATKMLRHLLWYEPSAAMIERVAGAYTRTGGDIKAMVRASLDFSHLQQAPAKLKRPFHFLVSALRALNPTVGTGVGTATRQLPAMGQALFQWLTPEGYPDTVEFWAGNLLPRWNAASTLSSLNSAEMQVNVTALQALNNADAIASEIGRMMFGGELQDRLREELVAYLRPAPNNATRIREALGLALASSPFQWY
ncbi:DUF1800 domain-containing protein [Roseisolibacter agri]|uniref:DUF1800 domain-containing protein n=1 Tax=Roseisolibacter agri TaxID=2014610 RepID=A0AA37Q022_9BACT|nr:DUF1800 domain-containing protein [Roseisolibacter agri]GLC24170.1 hypothetical protein rosag_06830 [Roseisolibacter agri]